MNTEKWYEYLPSDLLAAAYMSGPEMAWSRPDSIRVVDALTKNGCAVIGVDIWLPTLPGPTIPTPFVYDWDVYHTANTASGNALAKQFITEFQWDPRDRSHRGAEPYFNITASLDPP